MLNDLPISDAMPNPASSIEALHKAAWPDMFANLQSAYSDLTRTEFELERRVAEVNETRDLFERLIESMSDALFLFDRGGRVIRVNPAALELLGRDESEVMGNTLTNLGAPATVPATPWQLLNIAPDGSLKNLDVEITTRAGIPVPVSLSCTLVRDKHSKITGVLMVARDITERKRADEEIRAALREREVLLKEIHHRVKNNLQVISSLLSLQSDTMKDAQVVEIFKESQNRVRSMALIHEKLYQSKDFARIDLAGYTESLVDYLFRTYALNPALIKLVVDVHDVALEVDRAVPCGLILNELVSNSLKHAFPDRRRGTLQISLFPTSQHDLQLIVRDDGIGLPKELDWMTTKSLGLQLLRLLTRQLGGEVVYSGANGATFEITFPRVMDL